MSIEFAAKCKIRAVICYFVVKKKSPQEILNEVRTVYEEGHMNRTNVYKRCCEFKIGRTNKHMGKKKFSTNEEVKGTDYKWTKEVAAAFYEVGIIILICRLTTNIERDGDYVEK
ncbi:protein GVQW3-like [Aphis craccivora]|uniref:Protein GVQW3-like n=1 Tax=Aphis craccivora TaxID=307492 RepID=A0A6G0YG84_APHCR|nr:protein GVQW3-like [Aphis craccivora]